MVEQLVKRQSAERTKPLEQQSSIVYGAIAADIDPLQNLIDAELRDEKIGLAVAGPLRSRLIQLSRDLDEAQSNLARYQRIAAKGWPPSVRDAVYGRRIAIGMTAEQVRASWGEPGRINETLTATSHREQWVYGSSYVYFEKGIVVSIQRSR